MPRPDRPESGAHPGTCAFVGCQAQTCGSGPPPCTGLTGIRRAAISMSSKMNGLTTVVPRDNQLTIQSRSWQIAGCSSSASGSGCSTQFVANPRTEPTAKTATSWDCLRSDVRPCPCFWIGGHQPGPAWLGFIPLLFQSAPDDPPLPCREAHHCRRTCRRHQHVCDRFR